MTSLDAVEVPLDGLAIVVVNYRSHDLVDVNLQRVLEQLDGVHCIVVDAYSSEDERQALAAVCERHGCQMLPLDANRGFGASANEGASAAVAAGRDIVLFLNPDAHIDVAGLRMLVAAVRSRPDRLVSPRIVRPDGTTWFDGAATDRRTGMPGRRPAAGDEIPWLTGACLMASTDLWQRVGGFDDDYFMYWEDVDLSHRCIGAGGSVAVIDEATAVHDVGATQGLRKSPLYVRYCCRNRLLFAAKHLGPGEILRWLAATPRASWLIVRRAARRRDLLRSPRLVAAMLAGTAAGVLRALGALLARATAGAFPVIGRLFR